MFFFLVPFYGLFARLFLPFTRFYPLLFHELLKFYFNRKTLDATFLKLLSIKCFADNLFHVNIGNFLVLRCETAYLPSNTSITLISLGDTPGIRLACAKVSGSMRSSFWRPSVEISWSSE